MSSLWQDVRFSFRTLSKSPGFTLVAVLTMALGIGALSSIFSVVNAVLLRKLPYEDPGRLVLADGLNLKDETQRWSISYLDFQDLRTRLRTFESFAARTDARDLALRTDQGPEMIKGEIVSSPYFQLLGIKAAKGRTFIPEEDKAGGPRVAILSNEIWHSRYGGEPVVGRVITLDDLGYTVVGILPPGFRGLSDEAQVWLPLSTATVLGKDYEERELRWLYGVGRLKKDTPLEKARRDMDAVMRQLEIEYPSSNKDARVKATPLAQAWFGELKKKLFILLAGGMFLLLIVCTNLANLLLARFVARRRDLSLRMALGAGRRGLVRQILAESVLLALLGCAAGLLVARSSAGLLVRASGIQLKSFVNVNVDLVVVAVILVVSLAAGLLFGLVPALVLSTRLRLYEIFNDTGRRSGQGESHQRFQNMLIIGEVALALVLLVCAGLMAKGFQHLHDTQLGFKGTHLLTVRLNTKGERYLQDPALFNLVPEIRERIAAIPGVSSVALEGPYIPTDDWLGAYFTLDDRPPSEGELLGVLHFVSPGYFDTLGVGMKHGREVLPSDTSQAQRVAVINESMADHFWPGQNPVGKRILLGKQGPKNKNPWSTVVGVVHDVRHDGLLRNDERPAHNVYLSLLQQVPRRPSTLGVLVRTQGDPANLTSEVVTQLGKIAPDIPIYDPMTMEGRLGEQTLQNRSFVLLMSLFAFFALALAAVGVYGVVSYSVANRTQEIGVRMALGAQLRDVLRLVVGQGSRLALVGVALGLLLAALVTPVLQAWLFGVSPLDKVILVGMSLLLLGVAVAASYIPARRAAKVAPFQALRLE
ncbi:MAG TPA: ABC transporter permease [Thermoanaerobaculia bacterium]|nr:ABC transporter permease [Thermoanaerobaculia bacterium]